MKYCCGATALLAAAGDGQQFIKARYIAATLAGCPCRLGKKVDVALNGVSIALQQGDRLGLIGHNGSGKSTCCEFWQGFTSRRAAG